MLIGLAETAASTIMFEEQESCLSHCVSPVNYTVYSVLIHSDIFVLVTLQQLFTSSRSLSIVFHMYPNFALFLITVYNADPVLNRYMFSQQA